MRARRSIRPMMPKSIAADASVAQREQVSVMEIGVEESVDDRLAQESPDEDCGERLAIVAGGDQRLAVVELDAVEPFERKDPAGRAAPVDLRNVIAGLGDHVLAKLGRGGRLALQVELARGPLLELGDDETRAQALQLAAEAFDMGSGPFVGFDRPGDFLFDAGAKDLDGDHLAVGRDRLVHLGDRSGADGHRIEAFETAGRAARRTTFR